MTLLNFKRFFQIVPKPKGVAILMMLVPMLMTSEVMAVQSEMHYQVETIPGSNRLSYAYIEYQGDLIYAISDPYYDNRRGVIRLYRQESDGSKTFLGEKHASWSNGLCFLGLSLSFVIDQGRLYLNYTAPGDGGSGTLYVDEILITQNQATFEWTGIGIFKANYGESVTGGGGGGASRPFLNLGTSHDVVKDSSGQLYYIIDHTLNGEVGFFRIDLDGTASTATYICHVSEFDNPYFGKSLVTTSFDGQTARVIVASKSRISGYDLNVSGQCIEDARSINRPAGKIIHQVKQVESFGSSVPLIAYSETDDVLFSDDVTIRFIDQTDQLEGIYNEFGALHLNGSLPASTPLLSFFFINGQDHPWGSDPILAVGYPGDHFHGSHMTFYDAQGTELHRTNLGPVDGLTRIDYTYGRGTGLVPIRKDGHPEQTGLFVVHDDGAVITTLAPSLKKSPQTAPGAEAPEIELLEPFRIGNSARLKVTTQATDLRNALAILTIEGMGPITQFQIPTTNLIAEINSSTLTLDQYFPNQTNREMDIVVPIPNDRNLPGLSFSLDFLVTDENQEMSLIGERFTITR